MKKLLLFVLPFFCLASLADSMNVYVNGNLTALRPSATNAVLITAKSYTDAQIQAIPAAHDYAPDIATASNAVLTASKTYADTKLPKSGGTMTGNISMGNKKISSLGAPTFGSDAATKTYVDDSIDTLSRRVLTIDSGDVYLPEDGYLYVNGGGITGLSLPDSPEFAASKEYVDQTTNSVLASSKTYTDNAVSTKLSTSGGTMIGNVSFGDTYKITNLKDPSSNADAATKRYVDNAKSAALLNAKVYAETSVYVRVSADISSLENTLIRFSNHLAVLTGTGSSSANPPRYPNNSSPYALDASRSKVAITNTVAGASLSLLVDVVSPESTPVNATVQAGNSRYCTVNFSGFPSSGTVLFHLLVTCINTADFGSPAVVKDFYLSYTPIPE